MNNTRILNLTNKSVLLYSGLLTIIIFLTLGYFDKLLVTEISPNGIVSFELAKSLEQSQAILSSWDNNAKINAGLSLGFDYLFLFAYGTFFALVCFSIAKKFKDLINWFYKLGIYFAYLQFVAALFDAIENAALIKLLLGSNNEIYSSIAFYFASIKFVIIAVGFIYIIFGLLILLFHKGHASK